MASSRQAVGLLRLCVTKTTVYNVTTAPKCTNLRRKLKTWTRPLEGYWKYIGTIDWCFNWGTKPIYNINKTNWRCSYVLKDSQLSILNSTLTMMELCKKNSSNGSCKQEILSPGYTTWVMSHGFCTVCDLVH